MAKIRSEYDADLTDLIVQLDFYSLAQNSRNRRTLNLRPLGPKAYIRVGRINSHVQGTRPNAVSAFRTFVEYILCAYTRINRITFTYYATSILRFDYVSCYALRVN